MRAALEKNLYGMTPIFDPKIWAQVPPHFWTAVFFVLGCVVGSFLNVCIYRLPREESIIRPPSHCPHCGYSIPWCLNIPHRHLALAARPLRQL